MNGIFFLHGPTGKVEQYPYTIDEAHFTTDLIVTWSRLLTIQHDLPYIQGEKQKLIELKERTVQQEKILKNYNIAINQADDELRTVKASFLEIKAQVDELALNSDQTAKQKAAKTKIPVTE